MENTVKKTPGENGQSIKSGAIRIVEQVLSLEKSNLHLTQPHLINDVINIIKEEAKN